MLYLVLSILCSTILVLIFRSFVKYRIDNFQAIVFNYATCVACVSLSLGHSPVVPQFWQQPWFPYAVLLGGVFIIGFVIIALTVQTFGVTVGTIMQKMSIIISVTYAIFAYQESTPLTKIIGILFALIAIVLTNLPDKAQDKKKFEWYVWLYPAVVLISSGIIEIILQYVETRLTSGNGNLQFVGFLFGTAGMFGAVFLLGQLLFGKTKIRWKNIAAGIVLGIPNFGSIYFLMRALGMGWEGSVVFPINNIGVILLSTVLAIILFSERLNTWNWLGVGLAVLSIVLIGL